MSSTLTHGGLPASQAYKWTDVSTLRAFSGIIEMLYSFDPKRKILGYTEYFEFKRHFFIEEWDAMMDRLNEFRANLKKETIEELLESVRKEMIGYADVKKVPEKQFPSFEFKTNLRDMPAVHSEQLTLF
jgi:hypothetical protein